MAPDPDGSDDETGGRDDTGGSGSGDGSGAGVSRRDALKYGAGALVLAGAAGGGYALLSGGSDAPGEFTPDDEVNQELADRLAPVIRFGEYEQWYPTDPREYAIDRDGETVVDGFTALSEYTAAFRENDGPPAPTVCYRTLSERNSSLVVVQYWLYSAFDQFATNFHWHDWELLQVFYDADAEKVALVSASAHARRVPNNEYLGGPDGRIALLAEVGSHSSATDVNDSRSFERLGGGDHTADVTNALVRIAEGFNPLPLAYGLPRDEGGVLPYAVPELDGKPLYEHPDLPDLTAEDLIVEPLAVGGLGDLERPPTDVPPRRPGLTFRPPNDDAGEDEVSYALASMNEVADELDAFEGPQLSFEYPVPGVVEDQFAEHLTTTSAPWDQPRYDDPIADVTDAHHRAALEERFGLGGTAASGETVVAQVQGTRTDADGALRGAPDDARTELEPEIGYTLETPAVESVALLASDTVTVPTVGGAIRLTGVDPGEHRLVLDGAGFAPYAERLTVGESGDGGSAEGDETATGESDETTTGESDETTTDGTVESTPTGGSDAADAGSGDRRGVTLAGSDGYVTAVPTEDAVKVSSDGSGARGGVNEVRIEEDYAGAVYGGAPAVDEGFAAYVHRAGTYNVDVVDDEGVPGAARVDPATDGDGQAVELSAETGKAPLAEFLARYLRESADLTREYREAAETDDEEDGTGDASGDGGSGETTTDDSGETTTDDGGETTTDGDGSGNGGNATGGNGKTTGDGRSGGTTTNGGGNGGGAPGGAGVAQTFENAATAAERAAEAVRDGQLEPANSQLEAVRNRLDAVLTRIEAQRGQVLSETLATVLRTRAEGSDRRAAAALDADR